MGVTLREIEGKGPVVAPNEACQGGVDRGLGQGLELLWRAYSLHVESVLKRPDDWVKTHRRLGLRHTDNAKITTHRGDGRAKMEQHSEGLKVMVIDDSKTIRRTAETLLKKVGCDVITAVDGFDALAKIADTHPSIIFVDIMMPRLDGYQTCALIKNNSAFKSTPVIMLSSKDGLFDKAKGRIVGSDQYLTKPFSKEELLGAIKAHVPDFTPVEQAS
jgi:twitching motility two-component system response regulator PilG